ncbi:MAG: glycosyltransferase family 4 protein [Armatimonadota bacterium]
MNINQVAFRYYPASGGVEEYVRRISEALTKKGHKINIFTSYIEEDSSYTKVKNAPSVHNGVNIRRFRTGVRFKNYTVLPFMLPALLMDSTDIIHSHSYMYFSADAASIAAKLNKKPLVFNPYLADTGPPSLWGRIYRSTLGRMALESDVVIVISDYEKDLILKWGYTPKRIEKIPPGIDLCEFDKVNGNIYEKYGAEDKPKILYAGRLSKSKGVDTLIKAMSLVNKKMPSAELFLAGADFGQEENLKAIAGEMGLKEKIHFLGKLERSELVSAFKNADLFAFPSRYEAFGIVLIEAMLARTPVIAARNSAIQYVVNEGRTGLLFDTDNSDELGEKIINLFKNDKEREKLVENGYEEVLNNYSWDKTADKFEKVYESIINV